MNPEILAASIILINFILGVIVLLRQPNKADSRIFFITVCLMAAWTAAGYIADNSGDYTIALWAVKLAYFTSFNLLISLMVFTIYLSKARFRLSSFLLRIVPFLFAFSALSLTDLVVKDIVPKNYGVSEVEGPLLIPYLLVMLTVCVASIVQLIRAARHRQTVPQVRAQLMLVLYGIAVMFLIGVTFSSILPMITGSYETAKYGPLGLLVLFGCITTAMIKHRLFDVRLVVARSLAYVLSLGIIASIYAFIAFGLASQVFTESNLTLIQEVFYIAVALVLALTFHSLKSFFNRITQKVFLQDSYETQTVLDKTSTIIVQGYSINDLIKNTLSLLGGALKAQTGTVVLHKAKNKKRVVSLSDNEKQYDQMLATFIKYNQPIVYIDALSETHKLYALMQEANIAVIARLETSKQVVGYSLFGYKLNGNIYTNQDINVIRIVSDELALAIQNALRFEEIQAFNATLQTKVDEATAQLRRTNAKLRQLDEAKDEFISMASHQLRTPLTSVKGYLSMVLEGDAGDLRSGQKKLLEEAYAGAQRMVYLIADFLNVSRLKTGKFVLEYGNVNLAHLINEEIDQLRVTAKMRQLNLTYDAPETLPIARLDENKIRQVVMNLVDNAIYYSQPGGAIKVELFAEDDHVVFRVKDDGIGVPASEQRSLFEKFFRASNARKVRPDGTGIGLFMIKKVILAHGGSVIFRSAEGKGSTFGFRLPLKARPKSSELQAESIQQSAKSSQ